MQLDSSYLYPISSSPYTNYNNFSEAKISIAQFFNLDKQNLMISICTSALTSSSFYYLRSRQYQLMSTSIFSRIYTNFFIIFYGLRSYPKFINEFIERIQHPSILKSSGRYLKSSRLVWSGKIEFIFYLQKLVQAYENIL